MLDALLFALQSIAPGDDNPPASTSLLNPVQVPRCQLSSTEIVVCSHATGAYQLPKTDPDIAVAPLLPKAEWRILGDAKMSAHFAKGAYGVPAFMVTIAKPF